MGEFWSSFNAVSKNLSPFVSSLVKIMSLSKPSQTAIDPFQFLRFLKQVLVKSERPHFNIFQQQDAREILDCILYELCGDFILVQVKTRVTMDSLSFHRSVDNEDFHTIFQLPVANTVQSSLDLFLSPEHLSGDNSFFYNYCSSLQLAIIELRRFVDFQGTVTRDVNMITCFANIPIPVSLDNDIVEQRKFRLIFTVNHVENLNNDHHTAHVRNNFFSAWYRCNDIAVISCSKEVLENNTSYILFYKAV